MRYTSLKNENYSPLYFLSSLGAGGLTVSFFMYLMWMTPHKGQPVASFNSILSAFETGNIYMQSMIVVALLGITFFTYLHLRLLAWNILRYREWKHTDNYTNLRSGNGENQLMAMPLALAMSVNVLFIVGAVFVPNLWENAEILFPFALAAFAVIGIWGLSIFGDFMGRVLTQGGFDCAKNNSLGQMISVFAFAMTGVGFSASAAMSHNLTVSAIAFIGAAFFSMAAILFGAIFLVMGFRSMMENVAEKETSPTLWIIIPFITVVGITFYRMFKALDHNFGVEWAPGSVFSFLTILFAIQLVFGFLGYVVMKRFGYFEHYVSGEGRSPGSYALICPGVALFVFANFVVHPGLIGIGVLDKFSITYFVLYAPLIILQVLTIKTFFKLNAKLLNVDRDISSPANMAPAE